MFGNFVLSHQLLTARQIPALTLVSEKATETQPHVILLHGLQSSKEKYLEDLYLLASVGFRATAINLHLHGEQPDADQLGNLLSADYFGTLQEIIYETASDVGYLASQSKEKGAKVGLLGISAGGLTTHAAIATGANVDAAVAVCASPDWTTASVGLLVPPGTPAYDMLFRLSPVNSPDKYPPTALMMLNGGVDEVISPEGSQVLADRLRPIYDDLDIGHKLSHVVYPEIGHAYTSEMRKLALSWLETNLDLALAST